MEHELLWLFRKADAYTKQEAFSLLLDLCENDDVLAFVYEFLRENA